jgi:hypothetical protein
VSVPEHRVSANLGKIIDDISGGVAFVGLVFQDTERAGSWSVTFLLSGLDDQIAERKAKGISIERTTTSDYVKTATVTDPAANRVVFAELAAQH